MNKRRDLDLISEQLGNGELGQVEASERKEEVHSNAKQKVQDVQALFAIVDPAKQKLREIPDHLVDMVSFASCDIADLRTNSGNRLLLK